MTNNGNCNGCGKPLNKREYEQSNGQFCARCFKIIYDCKLNERSMNEEEWAEIEARAKKYNYKISLTIRRKKFATLINKRRNKNVRKFP